MRTIAQISLNRPDKPDRHFSLKIRQDIDDEPAEYPPPPRILAIANIEGNFQAFLQLLVKNKVVDKYLRWIFEDGHLVIVGDCFSRNKQIAECLWLIYSLEEKARTKGGDVHFILGNYEIRNLNGNWRYAHPQYAASTRIPYTALYQGNNELVRWLCTKNIMEKIGNTLFVHGGIAKELLQLNLSVTEVNRQARPWYPLANQVFTDQFLQIIFNSDASPLWYQGYYKTGAKEDLIEAVLKQFDVKTIVTGHTKSEQISSLFNGKLINLYSDHSGENSEALLIKKHRFYRVDRKGEKARLK